MEPLCWIERLPDVFKPFSIVRKADKLYMPRVSRYFCGVWNSERERGKSPSPWLEKVKPLVNVRLSNGGNFPSVGEIEGILGESNLRIWISHAGKRVFFVFWTEMVVFYGRCRRISGRPVIDSGHWRQKAILVVGFLSIEPGYIGS
jgi:hypothetical protein